ncbi:MAG TPA: NAD(P)-binding domain-containing protein [Brevundimonas sp.]|jgi:shikimate dehydrogenase|uniref:shikimate dehydrogenase family protein n=1 Tax=Brevundimonas sp. TaxID=1871086 RepID=UPI002DE2B3DA|nr:NAD(P)-binding domain-containing protein [Brevundimonas sp.]
MMLGGVVGWPIGHSLSPLIHGAWLSAAGITGVYQALPAEDEPAFDALIARGKAGMFRGLNVTAPWKLRALRAAGSSASETARRAGSANLLTFADGQVAAESTDGHGLLTALREQAPGLELDGARVTVLGAGGAARAAVVALKDAGAVVGVVNRSPDRARQLVAALDALHQTTEELRDADLVVNALPVDPAVDVDALSPHAVVMDMTYRPLHTPLLTAALDRGMTVVDGLAMLIGQARPSFQAIYGVAPPPTDVRTLCLRAMGGVS